MARRLRWSGGTAVHLHPPTVCTTGGPITSAVVNGLPRPTRDERGSADRATLARRRLLQGGIGGLGLLTVGAFATACSSGGGDTTDEGVSAGPDETLTALFPRDVAYIAAGAASRLVYTISDAEGVPALDIPEPMTFSVELDGVTVGEPSEVAPRSDGVPRPYLPFYVTFPRAGLYDVYATRGDVRLNSQVIVSEADKVMNPLVGGPLPSASTPTTSQSFDVSPICTRSVQCPFHEDDLATVLGTGRPVVVLLATPAYCRTAACGPILDLLVEEAAKLPDDVVVIHAEVYENPKDVLDLNDALLAPLPTGYKMLFEPSLFVADASNTIVARGDIVVDRGEMAEMLALAR